MWTPPVACTVCLNLVVSGTHVSMLVLVYPKLTILSRKKRCCRTLDVAINIVLTIPLKCQSDLDTRESRVHQQPHSHSWGEQHIARELLIQTTIKEMDERQTPNLREKGSTSLSCTKMFIITEIVSWKWCYK